MKIVCWQTAKNMNNFVLWLFTAHSHKKKKNKWQMILLLVYSLADSCLKVDRLFWKENVTDSQNQKPALSPYVYPSIEIEQKILFWEDLRKFSLIFMEIPILAFQTRFPRSSFVFLRLLVGCVGLNFPKLDQIKSNAINRSCWLNQFKMLSTFLDFIASLDV